MCARAARRHCPRSFRLSFTLVELLAGLIVIAILGAIFVPYLQGTLLKASAAGEPVQEETLLVSVMEGIGNDYDQNAAFRTDLALFREHILTDPSPYGPGFEVAVCEYVTFVDGTEAPGTEDDCLKVVIANDGGVLTAVFPKRAIE